MEYFFDSSAIIEIILGSENYSRFENLQITTTTLHMSEVYYFLLKKYDQQTADYWMKNLNLRLINTLKLDIAVEAARFRYTFEKEQLSYADCIGYITASHNNIIFLTRDKKFKDKKNAEFVE